MVLLAVVSRVPSMWYSLFDRNFLLEMFRVLHFAMPRLICKVWLQLESWVVLLKRNLIRSLRSDLVHCMICSQWEKLCVSRNLAMLTGWGSFHQRNNSFREHNTLFSEHMRPSSYNTTRPTRNTADPYFTMTDLSPINSYAAILLACSD